MGGGTSSKLLEPASQISTNFQCDNCHVTLNQVSWKQCNKCQTFDLCNQCVQIDYDKLIPVILDNHKQYHQQIGLSESITDEDITSISIVDAEPWANRDLDVRTETEFKRIVNQKRIENGYDMSIVMDMLKKNENPSISAEVQPSDINSMIAGYHTQAHKTKIHILSVDGGGIRTNIHSTVGRVI